VDPPLAPEAITYRAIGIVRSPYATLEGMPLQSVGAPEVRGQIEIHPSFVPGLLDLQDFSHLHVITHLHRGAPGGLTVVPFLDDTPRGIFATRSPRHPNPIGLSVVRLVTIRGATLEIAGVDLLDGTPVLDLKPYVPAFDAVAAERTGWLERTAHRVHEVRSDARFDDAPPGGSSG
jgi:tRNA (adenine37-N6)-methyltransferase